ncbi:DUF1254 domain-containing protein [Nitratireductor indicus]|uniref:DUF1254 domain-containing protein n=1 Tax=Nitratireductor indicus TaxID=721133 RepID=UPI0028762545|nr:DUF1254 domain-containing protein [Nitratireductor indicus]MDS1134601.1 DUF1254 domain-containing protein [Nitratireductor indicus]
MFRALHILLLGLFGAVIVHIAILFLLPIYSERDVWSALADKADLYTTVQLDQQRPDPALPRIDNPFFKAALCRFDLQDGMARITAAGRIPFWSISIYNRDGLNLFSLNDHSAAGAKLDVVVLDPAQMLELRKGLPDELEHSVLIQAEVTEGVVLVRGFMPDESWRSAVASFLGSMNCSTY